ncbi:MAG: PfkB family carbohydrate kinase [Coriobacteriia bacterium]|nr:PfkB family carbohydrate kinase [Coriobacteriia bacterium]
MEKPQKILSIGAVIVDLVCDVIQLPGSGQGEVVKGFKMSLGGSEANAANIIRQLGEDCQLLAPVGQGMFATYACAQLQKNGFEPFIVQTSLDNGACIILVEPNGERTMITLPGIERAFDPFWFDCLDAKQFSAVLTSGYELDGPGCEPIISFLEANPQILFYYAPGPCIMSVSPDKVARINALKPIWHLNDMEARTYTGLDDPVQAGAQILAECNNAVIVTSGAEGAHLFSRDEYMLVPSVRVEPVDTIGAGDAHLGALIAARNKGATWQESLSLANRIAAAVCLQKGALLPDATVEQLLQDAGEQLIADI